ncbi:hypothetical protein MHYP_G00092960 [Metynnis hypsauchen]
MRSARVNPVDFCTAEQQASKTGAIVLVLISDGQTSSEHLVETHVSKILLHTKPLKLLYRLVCCHGCTLLSPQGLQSTGTPPQHMGSGTEHQPYCVEVQHVAK